MTQNNFDAQDAPKPLLHPLDPSVEQEYDILTRSWKNQLIQNMPVTTTADYVRIAWIRLMDHYLDQHWLDSKQMLQCAQAWSARDSISISEAVHTMSTLSLKSMQRSLDARQELLNTLGDPEVMMNFGISPSAVKNEKSNTSTFLDNAPHRQQRLSHATTGIEEEEEDDDHEIHAPLFARHTSSPIEELLEAYTEQPCEENNQENEVWEDLTDSVLDKKNHSIIHDVVNTGIKEEQEEQEEVNVEEQQKQVEEEEEEEEEEEDEDIINSKLNIGGKSTFDIIPLSDRPNIIHHSNSMSDINTIKSSLKSIDKDGKHDSRSINHINNNNNNNNNSNSNNNNSNNTLMTSLKEVEQKDLDGSSICSSSKSDASSQLENGSPWKSWFLSEQGALESEVVHRKLTSYGHGDFANEKVETDSPIDVYHNTTHSSINNIKNQQPFLNYGHLMTPHYHESHKYPFKMVRSESSISAFRPISNNLAPRCQPTTRHRRNSSHTTTDSGDQPRTQHILKTTTATINKSTSFPTKAALTETMNTYSPSSPPPPPLPNKERNFMLRSIVSKKASLSKLFGVKKSLSSTSIS